jgi:energy-coupling factor transporter transmembrane protein EcfT
MNRTAAAVLGAVTIGATAVLLFFSFVYPGLIAHGDGAHAGALTLMDDAKLYSYLLLVGLWVFYIIYLFRTRNIPKEKKGLWLAVLFFANILAMPFFWYVYVWKTSSPA